MKISKITLTNFKVYKGVNKVLFDTKNTKNISIITGKNGYGKTSFLTSLIWCFYGRLMSQVEDKYRTDIKSYGGYDSYLISLINREILNDYEKKSLKHTGFSIEVELTDLLIPSIPCDKVIISRSYDLASKNESLSILIDGMENELTKDVGYDLFINDFILPREIAKFFFFDAEKIVSLAEAKTKEELRNLSKAYSEVLGIKKYEDLKKNLETLLTKLRRDAVAENKKVKVKQLEEKELELQGLIKLNLEKQSNLEKEISSKRKISDDLQEKLIREGNEITVEELKSMKMEREALMQQSSTIKAKLNQLMNLAPLIIAGKKLALLRDQIIAEQQLTDKVIAETTIRKEIQLFSETVLNQIEQLKLYKDINSLKQVFQSTLNKNYSKSRSNGRVDILVGFDEEQYLKFEAVYSNIKNSYVEELNKIVQEEKSNRVLLSSINKKIKQAEARKDNVVAIKYREEKNDVNTKIAQLTTERDLLIETIGKYKLQLKTVSKELTEYEKYSKIRETDKKKYKVTQKLLDKINQLVVKVKVEKKYALQKSLYLGLNKLMHKNNFIKNVDIIIDGDIMNINLIDFNESIIPKDTLSKGEQQLYATALLKSLIDQSCIKFPVFIDSPLQKFDKTHSKNIITEFYPTISNQVVLLPLLEKELTEQEFNLLEPNLNKAFLIESKRNSSQILACNLKVLFKKVANDVYTD